MHKRKVASFQFLKTVQLFCSEPLSKLHIYSLDYLMISKSHRSLYNQSGTIFKSCSKLAANYLGNTSMGTKSTPTGVQRTALILQVITFGTHRYYYQNTLQPIQQLLKIVPLQFVPRGPRGNCITVCVFMNTFTVQTDIQVTVGK